MKLSQKLLALGGVTLADYACCPYDDYGMPHTACTNALPEKTPFSLESDWRNGACKAWESNVDATYDGNDNNCGSNEDWGSCGFQRHFPWNEVNTENYRNRGCLVTHDVREPAASSGAVQLYDQGAGCHCNNYADTETNVHGDSAIACKSVRMHAGSNASPAISPSGACTGGEYTAGTDVGGVLHEDMTAAQLASNDICCDSTLTAVTTSSGAGVRVDCFRDCNANDIAGLATCYEDDFLGRRNIQEQSLFIKNAAQYSAVGTSELEFSWTSNAAATTTNTSKNNNSQLYNLAGVPFLGGVCKLFVPVPRSRVTSVQIAGVHVNIDGPSVFAAKVGTDNTYTQDSNSGTHVGTAYCFSVVNPAEGMNNSNGIHNGNVAGGAVGSNSVFNELVMTGTSLERQAGLEPAINFFDGSDENHIGTQLKDDVSNTVSGPIASGDSEVGANFDVVVHIHSEWCNSQSFWNYADMQLTGDYNNGNNDYPLNLAPVAAGQDQFTAPAYAEGQTGTATVNGLQLEQLQDVVTNNQAAEDALLIAFNTARAGLTTCFDQLTSTCPADFDAYMTAYFANEDCTAAGTCTTEAATLAAAKAVLFTDSDTDGTVDDGCMFSGPGTPHTGCTVNLLEIDEVTAFLATTAVTAYRDAIIATTAAEAAVTAAQNNGFTHAHMDLIDKRHAMTATWNNVYEKSGDYLQFPHSADDAFKNIDGTTGTYTAAAEYLRWPNAGAFAAFYSFVTCANPPHIHETALTDVPVVNPGSVIYSKNVALSAPNTGSETSQYAHYGKNNLEGRTLVMSQSDSDYRDEKCDERIFRGNLRQVGNDVTVCGPGQLPDTDEKRCSWNWNYHSSNDMTVAPDGANAWNLPSPQSPFDAEEWFDRNNPHNFDMWSTRKRRSESANSRKYAFNEGYWGVQQGKPAQAGAWNAGDNWNADSAEHGAAIEIPIQDFNFNLIFKTASGEYPATPAYTENIDDCFFADSATDCVCRPSIRSLTGLTTEAGDAITFTAVAGDANAFTFDFTNFKTTGNSGTGVVHSSCADANDICTQSEIDDIKTNLEKGACDGYKATGNMNGFKQTDNIQTLVFDDPRVKTSLNPTLTPMEWEVSVQCDRTDMANIGTDVAQRDLFPDCFFGDELWFSFTYSTSANSGQNAYDSYVSSWTSELSDTAQNYIST